MRELLRLSWDLARLGGYLYFPEISGLYIGGLVSIAFISASNGWTGGDLLAIYALSLTYSAIFIAVFTHDPWKE